VLWCALVVVIPFHGTESSISSGSIITSTTTILPVNVSRRSTNLPFCIWALAHNVTLLWALWKLETWLSPTGSGTATATAGTAVVVDWVPPTWRAVNRHGIVAFLVANVATGLVNLTVPTIDTGDAMAMAILLVYICGVGIVVRIVDASWTPVSKSELESKFERRKPGSQSDRRRSGTITDSPLAATAASDKKRN